MDRIIGDFLEINADIVKQQVDSTLPAFISKLRAKYFRKKLLRSLHKLKKKHYVLTCKNIAELFTYTFNNFSPKGNYNSIKYSKVKVDSESYFGIEGIVEFDNLTSIISMKSNDLYFEINTSITKDDGSKDQFNLTLQKMYTDNNKYHDTIYKINEKLLDELISYIDSILNHYI